MFPDIANVLAIRDALWRHRNIGSASVMVGAGFSRNGDPVGVSARLMPTWSEMAEALCRPLYPSDPSRLQSALSEARGTSGFLRLAQEYQAAFGPAALNDRIRTLAPDTDYRPGDLHRRLLRLPWADVFSTNWDTLLERARDDVFNRSYDVIRTPDEIPFTQRPRIVKLHGSFPAHHPLVFTEDDYRTYPVTHAPFVNLVQQSMMETLFCLIGFSGDDPNFLHWAGWVKDNLGQSAPRIYLIGWLDISNHRRRMLEARNVMPIDLAALPAAADWPIDLRHRYANEWFLSALEGGERYNPSNWPARPPRDAHPANPLLGELPMLHQAVPIDTAWSPKDPDAGQGLMTQVAAWRHNRQVYPGWLVAPNHVRNDLWQRSERWFNSLTEISELTPRQRLEAFVEVAWILDRCLFPLFQNLESSAFEALEAVNLQLRLVGEEAITDFDEWRDLLAMSDGLALSLARNGRHANNRDLFDRALDWLKQRALHDPKLNNAITHELCLWDSAAGDLNRLSSRLGDWTSTDNDALWLLRKAGFLAELGEDGRACETLEHALGSVRRGRRRDVDDIPALSIESWAMYLALAYDRRWRDQETEPVLSPDQPRPFDRWRVLGELDCNAWIEIQELTKTLQSRQKSTPAVTERRGFDLYHVATTHHLGSGTPESQRAAYAVLMISELTGIPPAARNVTLLESALTEAAQVLAEDEPWMAAHLAARMHMSSSKQDTLIDRRWVARLPLATATAIRDSLMRRTSFLRDRIAAETQIEDVNGIAACLELLSRIAVRLPTDDLLPLAAEALAFHRMSVVARYGHQLWPPLNNLLRHVLEALPGASLVQLLLALVDAPLPSNTDTSESRLEPIQALPSWFNPKGQHVEDGDAWNTAIATLIAAAGATGQQRIAAVARLQQLYSWNLLTERQVREYAENLWSPDRLDDDGLPQHTNYLAWAAIRMPERFAGQARTALAARLTHLLTQESDVITKVTEVADQLAPLSRGDPMFALGSGDSDLVHQLLLSWCSTPLPHESRFHRAFSSQYRNLKKSVAGAASLGELLPPDVDLGEAFWSKREELERHSHLAGVTPILYPALARYRPDRSVELVAALRHRLASDDSQISNGAMNGLFRWINSDQNVGGDASQADLNEAVLGVTRDLAACRRCFLPSGLNLARWIFSDGPSHLRDLIAPDCDLALSKLLTVASYEASREDLDVPAVRAGAVALAYAMARDGRQPAPGVDGWMKIAPTDPLPEVRHAGERRGLVDLD